MSSDGRKKLAAVLVLTALWAVGVRLALWAPRLEVRLEMRSDTAGTAQLFVDDGGGFREALSDRAVVRGDGAPETLRFELAVSRVDALRIDPLDRAGRVGIEAIEVAHGGAAERFASAGLDAWRPAHQLEAVTDDSTAEDALALRAVGTDPWLVAAWEGPSLSPWRMAPSAVEAGLVLFALPLFVLAVAPPRRRGLEHVLALTAPVGLFLTVNVRALGSFWTYDDPCLLASALRHGGWAHFVDPAAWRALSGSVLMPWTLLSFRLDAALFGLVPRGFYVHQLVAGLALLAVAYVVLRRFLGAGVSCLALALLALATPTHALVQLLMNRHYVEGTILVLGALAFYCRAVESRSGRWPWAVAGAGLYLAATSAKEVFVPLVVVLPFLPVGALRERLRASAPFGVAAAVYAAWRTIMLGPGNVLSGYAPRGREPEAVLGALGLAPWGALVVGFLAVGGLVVLARRSPAAGLFGVVLGAVLAAPLLPVLDMLAPRHFFLPALLVATLGAVVLAPWWTTRRGAASFLAAAVGLVLLVADLHVLAASPLWQRHGRVVETLRAEGSYVLEGEDDGVLLTGVADPRYLACLVAIRRQVLEPPEGPGYCGDPCYCAAEFPGASYRRVAGGEIVAAPLPERASCAVARPLEVTMSYDAAAHRLAWSFGPDMQGAWSLLLVGGVSPPEISPPAPLAASGEAPLGLFEPLRAVVRHRAPDGSLAYAPVLVDPRSLESPPLESPPLE